MLPMRDKHPNEQLKIELLSQWKLEAESRNLCFGFILGKLNQLKWNIKLSFGVYFLEN